MSANISFYAGINQIQNLSGSGLGFYGSSGFGASVQVGSWQGKTYITSSAGTSLGPEGNNIQYQNSASGIINGASSGIAVTAIPNYQASLNIRFQYDSAVKVQNATLYIYDRTSINNGASGVTTKVAELIHPTTTQVNNGSGDTSWQTPNGSGVTVSLAPSPGVSGIYAGNGSNSLWTDNTHDWYIAISQSPDSVGSKVLNALFLSLEYL